MPKLYFPFRRLRSTMAASFFTSLNLPTRGQIQRCHLEGMYHRAFLDLKNELGIQASFHPFGSAANSSLLYVIARAVATFPIRNVCEIGSGQTTLLFDALAGQRTELRVTSFEHQDFWARHIQKQIKHTEQVQVVHKKLSEQLVRGTSKQFHDLSDAVIGQKYDLLLIDGPNGEKKKSRWGSLQLIEKNLADEFLVVFDDAERFGEEDTYFEAIRILEEKGIKFQTAKIEAAKTQLVIATPKMSGACYF